MTKNAVIYEYDGSFEGLLCCVFESFDKKEIPLDIVTDDKEQILLLSKRYIENSQEKSNRVYNYIVDKGGKKAINFIKKAFLTCHPRKEYLILIMVRKIHKQGQFAFNDLSDNIVSQLFDSIKNLNNEAHLFKGFIRFSIKDNFMIAQIEPKNNVLPLIKNHFIERFPNECFMIYDKTHSLGLLYKPYRSIIVHIDEFNMDTPTVQELEYRKLWKNYYDSIAIKERENHKCRQSHMPKRYWGNMTEFQDINQIEEKINIMIENK